jgi:hypothetical protein
VPEFGSGLLVECYVTVRILGVLQLLQSIVLATALVIAIRWMALGPVSGSGDP